MECSIASEKDAMESIGIMEAAHPLQNAGSLRLWKPNANSRGTQNIWRGLQVGSVFAQGLLMIGCSYVSIAFFWFVKLELREIKPICPSWKNDFV